MEEKELPKLELEVPEDNNLKTYLIYQIVPD